MAPLMNTVAILLSALAPGSSYETWHLIDIASVVCPKPATPAGMDPLPDFGIEVLDTATIGSGAIVMDRPYVFSILRTSDQAVQVDFTVKDSSSPPKDVVPPQSVTLQGFTDTTVEASCVCLGTGSGTTLDGKIGVDYGSKCQAWDNDNCDTLWGADFIGSFCCQPWCYVDPEKCSNPGASELVPGNFWSNKPCQETAPVTPCTWTAQRAAQDSCACKDSSSLFTTDMQAKLPMAAGNVYGAQCSTWDKDNCEVIYPDSIDTWCCSNWCYVDSTCSDAKESLWLPGQLYWSDKTCDSLNDPVTIAQCPYQKQVDKSDPDVQAKCGCIALDEITSGTFPPGVTDAAWGSTCAAWDKDNCATIYPGVATDMWCCMPWCFVNSECPGAKEHPIMTGKYYSDAACSVDQFAEDISSCKYSDACTCVGGNALPTNMQGVGFGANFGSSCEAWDSGLPAAGGSTCKALWGPSSSLYGTDGIAFWSDAGANEWCCSRWCYVSTACPIALPSAIGANYYYSYATCDDDPLYYVESSDTCQESGFCQGNVKSAAGTECCPSTCMDGSTAVCEQTSTCGGRTGGADKCCPSTIQTNAVTCTEDTDTGCVLDPAITTPSGGRRLSGRRRSGSSSYSSPRRRAPISSSPRRRTASPPRRRRRRAAPAPTRRRAPQRPAVDTRRRRATSSTSSTSSSSTTGPRRRQAVQGNNYNTPGGTPYGYGNKAQMQNNYGGQQPQTTSYGHSGQSAYSPNYYQSNPTAKKPNVAMYAAGGAAAGVVAGAGAYYMYSSYNSNNNNDGWSGRRRSYRSTNPQQNWCVVPSGPSAGQMMECRICNQRYGVCKSSSDCYSSGGCSYDLQKPLNRDDIGAAGFIPKDFPNFPYTIQFSKIEGLDIDKADICPPTTQEEKEVWSRFNKTLTIKADMFLTLTEMETFPAPGPSPSNTGSNTGATRRNECAQDTGTPCKSGATANQVGESACYGPEEQCKFNVGMNNAEKICYCKTGYCLSGTSSQAGCIMNTNVSHSIRVGHSSSVSMGLPVLMALLFTFVFPGSRRRV